MEMGNDDYAAAAARVLAIPELLENILIHATSQSDEVCQLQHSRQENTISHAQEGRLLFRLQVVNKTFHETIMHSRACRRAMFLEYTHDEAKQTNLPKQLNAFVFGLFPITDERSWRLAAEVSHYLPNPIKWTQLPKKEYTVPWELLTAATASDVTESWKQTFISSSPAAIGILSKTSLRAGCSKLNHFQLRKDAPLAELISRFVDILKRTMEEGIAKATTEIVFVAYVVPENEAVMLDGNYWL